MARIESGSLDELIDPIDETILVDRLMPKSWKCPRCKRKNTTGKYANAILVENFKYLEHCDGCCAVHAWHLELTDQFKRGVVNMLLGGGEREGV